VRKTRAFERQFARFQKNFGTVVSRLRRKVHLSRLELAAKAKLSVSTLAQIERGHGNPSLNRMENLAAALEQRLSHIFELAQDMDKK